MKKLYALTVLISLLVSQAYAGHSESVRRYCFWMFKRYYAQVHLTKPGILGIPPATYYDAQANCTGAFAHLVGPWGYRCEFNSIAHSQANAWGAWGYLQLRCGVKGGMHSALYEDLSSDSGGEEEVPVEANNQETRFAAAFSDETVTISDISILLESEEHAAYDNFYTLTLWTPMDDSAAGTEDMTITADKIIYSGTVTLRRGELFVEGTLFAPSDFEVTRSGGLVRVSYAGGDKHLVLPLHIAPARDMMVTGTGDIKNDEGEFLKKALDNKNGVVKGSSSMRVYPNPAAADITVDVQADKDNTVRIGVYDMQGKVVLAQTGLFLSEGENSIRLPAQSLPAGQYYLLLTGDDMKIVTAFIKE